MLKDQEQPAPMGALLQAGEMLTCSAGTGAARSRRELTSRGWTVQFPEAQTRGLARERTKPEPGLPLGDPGGR